MWARAIRHADAVSPFTSRRRGADSFPASSEVSEPCRRPRLHSSFLFPAPSPVLIQIPTDVSQRKLTSFPFLKLCAAPIPRAMAGPQRPLPSRWHRASCGRVPFTGQQVPWIRHRPPSFCRGCRSCCRHVQWLLMARPNTRGQVRPSGRRPRR